MVGCSSNWGSGSCCYKIAVSNKMFVPEKLGAVVKKVRMDCSMCRIILKKTSELQMAEHPESRTILAPPFYHTMMDIVFNFSGKTHKKY